MPKKILISQLKNYKDNVEPLNYYISKEKAVLNFLIKWIEDGIKDNQLNYGDIIPSKNEIANLLDVSPATVQNAVRYIQKMGLLESKQCVGTMIADKNEVNATKIKMSSKMEVAISRIKRLISKMNVGDNLPSVQDLAQKIGISNNTVRLAFEVLIQEGYIKQKTLKGYDIIYVILKNNFEDFELQNVVHKTLSQKLSLEIKKYIALNYKVGDKIMKNDEFAKLFKVSIRTINDAMKILNKEGTILSRRGQYGTIYMMDSKTAENRKDKNDKNMFMTTNYVKHETILYNWQEAMAELQKYISKNFEAGDRIPSMHELAKFLNVSLNSIRKAVLELSKEGILYTQRGRYGGIFVNDMPTSSEKENYSWLALNPDFFN